MTLPKDKIRAAIYAQERRDNEIEARKELQKRVVRCTLAPINLDFRGDFNLTTKVLAQTLLCIKPHVDDFPHTQRRDYNTKSAEYNAMRRANEADVRDLVKDLLPAHILNEDFMQQSNLNQSTKIIVAAAKYLDELEISRVGQGDLIHEARSDDACDSPPASVKVVFTLLRIDHVHFLTTIKVFDTKPNLPTNSFYGGQRSLANQLHR